MWYILRDWRILLVPQMLAFDALYSVFCNWLFVFFLTLWAESIHVLHPFILRGWLSKSRAVLVFLFSLLESYDVFLFAFKSVFDGKKHPLAPCTWHFHCDNCLCCQDRKDGGRINSFAICLFFFVLRWKFLFETVCRYYPSCVLLDGHECLQSLVCLTIWVLIQFSLMPVTDFWC